MAGNELDMETSNPEELQSIFDQLESGQEPAIKKVEPDPAASPAVTEPPKVEPAPVVVQPKEAQAAPEVEPEGVATKDGKHVIPYSVLRSERERATRAEQVAKDANDRLAALEAQVKAGTPQANNGDNADTKTAIPDVQALSPEDLEALKEDFPTVYRAVMASMAAAKALEARMNPIAESVQNDNAARARTEQEVVQDAIDSVPKMAHLQASNDASFALAKQFDAALRAQSAWIGKPLAERFAKVIEMVESATGAIDVPGSQKPAPQPTAEELKALAQATAAKAAKKTGSDVPLSLSEFPVGTPAASDEAEAAQNMTVQQLADKFTAMSPEQMDAYFQTL